MNECFGTGWTGVRIKHVKESVPLMSLLINMYYHERVRKQAVLNYYYLYVVTLIPYSEISGIVGNLLMCTLTSSHLTYSQRVTHTFISSHLTC